MKKAKKISFLLIFTFALQTVVFATDVKFVDAKDAKPKFSIFSLFKKKEKPKDNQKDNLKQTAVIRDAEEFTALDGMLSVKKNTPATGSLDSTVPGEGVVVFSIETEPQLGTIEITDAMNGDFVYTPNEDVVGEDSFVFAAESEEHGKKTATISVTIEENGDEEPSPTDGNDGENGDNEEESPSPSPTETPYVPSFKYEDMLDHWGAYSASILAEKGILVGFKIRGKYFFYPEVQLTRGDFILYLVSALNLNVDEYSEISSPFADADETPAWMNLQAKAAYDAGIIKGSLEDGQVFLRPYEPLTRLEAIAMLNNTIKPRVVSVTTPDYTDMYLVPEWGISYIQNMTAYGLLQGYDDNTLRPFAKITRAQAAEMIHQTMKYNEAHPEVKEELENEMDKKMEY
ncbi:MAG: S-layer homology domain-containing protein [Eubacteriales bacterium]|jgi:hypothetical protein|nr:S-layer homology domain-containing protein [Eubacteriales bacterium]